jgi:hypothetical protein
MMNGPRRNYTQYKTYKRTFERLRPLFWLLYKADRVPKSFYTKFTLPDRSASLATPEAVSAPEPTTQAPGA